jgi:hypothetical protein
VLPAVIQGRSKAIPARLDSAGGPVNLHSLNARTNQRLGLTVPVSAIVLLISRGGAGDTSNSSRKGSTLDSISRQAGRGNTVPCQDVVLLPADRTEPSCKDVCPRPRLRRRQKTKEVFEQISWGRSADARKAIGRTSSAWLYAPHRTRQVRTDLNGRAGRFVTEFVQPGYIT